tara:strand:- start:1247 stop:1669 length:423 start_codon:yes stop_codon:yes gene_type:complete
LNLKIRIKIYLKYILINLLSLAGAIFTFFLFQLCSVKTIINVASSVASFFLRNFRKRVDFKSIFFLSRKINRFLGIESCFRICVSQKIVLSIFGYDVQVVCGVKSLSNKPIDGHAWIVYESKPILEQNENIDNYITSFVI